MVDVLGGRNGRVFIASAREGRDGLAMPCLGGGSVAMAVERVAA